MLFCLFLDNVVQIGNDFQAEIPDYISGIILLFLFDYYLGDQLLRFRVSLMVENRSSILVAMFPIDLMRSREI